MAMMKESMSSSSLTTGPCSSLAVTAGVFCCGPPAKQSIKTGSRNQLQLKPNTRSPSGVWPSVPITDGSSLEALTSDNKLLIDDDETCKLLYSFEHPDYVKSISLQPGTNGNNFATACDDGIFRLFDVRRSTTDAVCQSNKRLGVLRSVMFSPVEPNVLVATGLDDGALLYDIRQPSSCLFSFPKEKKTVNAKFDSSVKRLLCLQRKQLVVYDLPTLQHPIVNRNVILTAPNFSAKIGTDPFGFAGLNDDLVISASDNNGLMIWASPDGRHQQDQTVDQPIQVLQGHNHFIRNVRYSNEASAIVSCDADGIIKLWTPGVPLHKTST